MLHLAQLRKLATTTDYGYLIRLGWKSVGNVEPPTAVVVPIAIVRLSAHPLSGRSDHNYFRFNVPDGSP